MPGDVNGIRRLMASVISASVSLLSAVGRRAAASRSRALAGSPEVASAKLSTAASPEHSVAQVTLIGVWIGVAVAGALGFLPYIGIRTGLAWNPSTRRAIAASKSARRRQVSRSR